MNSEYDEQKHRTEQTNPRSKNPEQLNEAANGVKSKSLFEKTDFVITDQTGYNFKVDEIAAETLYSEHNRLFCNVHPTLMFNSVIIRQ